MYCVTDSDGRKYSRRGDADQAVLWIIVVIVAVIVFSLRSCVGRDTPRPDRSTAGEYKWHDPKLERLHDEIRRGQKNGEYK